MSVLLDDDLAKSLLGRLRFAIERLNGGVMIDRSERQFLVVVLMSAVDAIEQSEKGKKK